VNTPKPKWWLLYAVFPLGATLLAAAELVSPSAGWRMFVEGLASLTVLCAIALWVRTNRVALALRDEPSDAGRPLKVWVAYCPPAALRRRLDVAEIPRTLPSVVHTEPIRREEVITCCAK
jgi:hypothetical protein